LLRRATMDDFPIIAVRSYSDLITALRAVKQFRQLSDAELEALAGLTRSHWTKIAGACPTKRAGPAVLDALLGALAIELHVKPDPQATQRMAHRWTRRRQDAVRTSQPISQSALERCRPIILSELARKGWRTRRRHARANGHSNGHNGHAR
jgi:hypothetical protein